METHARTQPRKILDAVHNRWVTSEAIGYTAPAQESRYIRKIPASTSTTNPAGLFGG